MNSDAGTRDPIVRHWLNKVEACDRDEAHELWEITEGDPSAWSRMLREHGLVRDEHQGGDGG